MKTENQNTDVTHATSVCPDSAPSTQHSELGSAPSRPRRTTRRRMRRTRSANENPDSGTKNSTLNTQNSRASSRARRASPFQILPEFAQLSAADLAEVHNIIRDVVVPDAQKFIFQRHGISLSGHCLYRYRSRLHLADQLQVSEDNAPAIQNLARSPRWQAR